MRQKNIDKDHESGKQILRLSHCLAVFAQRILWITLDLLDGKSDQHMSFD